MEPTAIAAAITTLLASEALKAGGKSIGEGMSKLVGDLLTAIRNRFKADGVEGIVTRVEKQTTDSNLESFKSELVRQIEGDEKFARELRVLLDQSKRTF